MNPTQIKTPIFGTFLLLLLAACGTNPQRGNTLETRTGTLQWPDVATGASLEESARDVAVLVAIEDYTFLPDVPGAVQNAEDWKTFLKSNLGINQIYTLYNQDASREEILKFAERAAQQAGPGSRVWFVFVGHGAPSAAGEGLLVGMDAQQTPDSLSSRSAPQNEITAALTSTNAEVVMVLDACFSGRDSSGAQLAKGTQPVVPVVAATVAGNVTVLSAAQATEFAGALPNAERPAFSYLLLGAMRGWADDGDGALSANEAIAWTRDQLRHVPGRTQTPTLAGKPQLVLTRGAREADPGISELMRGNTLVVEKTDARHDTGKGVSLVPPAGWYLHSSVPADYWEESLTTTAEFYDANSDTKLNVHVMRWGANKFVANVNVMNGSLSDQGGTMIQQQALELDDGRSALYQRWRMPTPDGHERAALAFYVKHGDDMWILLSSTDLERADWLLRVNREVWGSLLFY